MEVVLLQSAQADIMEIYARHGEASYHAVDASLESIRRMPELAPIYSGRFRRKVVERSPFGVFYTITGERLMVSFVMDLRQDPKVIAERIKKGS